MATLKIKLRGQDFTPYSAGEDSGFDYYKHERTYAVDSPTRGDMAEHIVELTDDQIVELDFVDDTVWIGDQETLRHLFPLQFKRGALINELDLPDELHSDEQDRSLIKKAGIKLFKVFSKKKIKPAIRELAFSVENKQLRYNSESFEHIGPGILLRCSEYFELEPAGNIDGAKTHLLFLHGTGSSTCGSFMDLKDAKEWPSLIQTYGENILAFQHRTLTCSPLENSLELLKALPSGIKLDLVSHSRGGLVADILARYSTENGEFKGFDRNEREILKSERRTQDLKIINEIDTILKDKKIVINNVVRVACPANGTTLASSRLNFYLNVTFNLIGLASGQLGNPIYTAFKELIMAAVENKDDAEILPGLEAMNPQSPFIKILNNPGTTVHVASPLIVVGGSSELSLKWKSLLVLTGKFFFRDKNDLVVDTESMKWGALRKKGNVSVFIEKSGDIDHICYFGSLATSAVIIQALLVDANKLTKAFVKFDRPYFPDDENNIITDTTRGALGLDAGSFVGLDKVSGKKPIIILLPGIMGSNLSHSDKKLWINYWNFVRGHLDQLAYTDNNDPHITADSLVATSYRRLGKYLSKDYDLVTFAFDWRRSLTESAEILNGKIKTLLECNQPIKIIGHSMGGVLVRDFIINYPDTWNKLNHSLGFKAVLLGSPLGGSYRIPYVLFGQDEMIRLLGKIDLKSSVKSLLGVFCNMPGILNLLPINRNGKHDFSDRGFWENLRTAFGDESWPIPERRFLEQFGAYQNLVLEKEKEIDYTNIVYIAGQSRVKKSTVSSLDIKDGKLVFDYTHQGDESVTWESGIPEQLIKAKQFYYTNVTHGSLSNETKLFAAISDILIFGATSKLQNSLPKLRGIDENVIPKETEIFDISCKNVVNTLLGLSEDEERWHKELPIEVSVTNGNLRFAKFPVLAGHYEVDAILKSEKVIDEQLDGELSRLRQLGLYPGGIGSNQIVLSPPTSHKKFKGAVIVGLGVPGELTGYLLTQSIEKGISRYLTICNTGQEINTDNRQTSGISVIAIANSYGGLSTDSSIRSIILGIQKANRNIHSTYHGKIRGIEEIEIIEIYHDRALSILKAVKRLEMDDSREFNISYKGKGLNKTIGRQQRIPFDRDEDWWTRIRVVIDKDSQKSDFQGNQRIKMSITTAGASEKMETLRTNSKSLDLLLEEMTDRNQFSPDIAKTMFELLIPLNFKEELKRQSNISWILDKNTATYPWEMMQEDMDAMPLCIHSGMVRQLATKSYRKSSNLVTGMNAYIVADPDLAGYMGQLPGAKREGSEVNTLLLQHNYETVSLINSNPSQILLKLFTQEYKIIHLAGHGIFNPDPSRPTGMVIGPNAFLTVNEIAQMSTVPELVFVNCCYLGKVDRQVDEENNTRHKLAANIGTQLIENGVKAVIVAGWAVDDEAALAFCKQFYKYMFEGCGFGDAVKNARKHIYENFRFRTNTWGAFQCYGDPFYKLNNEIKDTNPGTSFFIQEDIEIELQNLIQEMECNDYDPDVVLARVQELETYMDKMGLESDNITELLAGIYAGLDLYEESTVRYQKLMQSANGGYSIKAMEKGCNIRSKNIVKRVSQGIDSHDKALHEINDIIDDLQSLLRFGRNAERLCLLGSAYKRKLIILSKSKDVSNLNDKKNTLKNAIEAYNEARKLKGHNFSYAGNNWLQLYHIDSLASEISGEDKTLSPEMEAILDELREEIYASEESKKEFWDLIKESNLLLTEMILKHNKVTSNRVLESYFRHWNLGGHRGHKSAEIEHLDILLLTLNIIPASKNKALKKNLTHLKNELLKF